jgi:hypothetical protein
MLFGMVAASSASAASLIYYVRSDGAASPTCNGLSNAPAAATPNCAFQTLAQADTAAGTGDTINVVNQVTVAASITIPADERLNFMTFGALSVNASQTVTLSSQIVDPGDRRVFAGAGDVVFAAGVGNQFNLGWWADGTDASDDTNGFENAFTSLANNFGGKLTVPGGEWRTTGNLDVPSGTTISGKGHRFDNGNNVTTVVLTEDDVPCFKVGDSIRNINFEDLRIVGPQPLDSAIGILAKGTYPNSAFGLNIRNVIFNHLSIGLSVDSGVGTAWELEQIQVDHSFFINTTKGIYTNTINTSTSVTNTHFLLPPGGDGIYIDGGGFGTLTIDSVDAGGQPPPDPYCTDDVPDFTPPTGLARSFIYVNGNHIAMNIRNSAIEGAAYFLINNLYSYNAPITLIGNTIQGRIQMHGNAVINSFGNEYNAYNLVRLEADSVFTSIGDTVGNSNGSPTPQNDCSEDVAFNSIYLDEGGAAHIPFETNNFRENVFKRPVSVWDFQHSTASSPMLTLGSDVSNKTILRLGQSDTAETMVNYYDIKRDGSGYLSFLGNQALPSRAFLFNGPLRFSGEDSSIPLSGAGEVVFRINASHFAQMSANGEAWGNMLSTQTGINANCIPLAATDHTLQDSAICKSGSNYTLTGNFITTGTQSVGGNQTVTGSSAVAKAATSGVATLTDAATIATDASLGNLFRVTLGGNRTLGNPTSAVDGQEATWEIIQDGTGSRTLAFGGQFTFGTDVPNCTVTSTANKRSFLTAVYNSAATKWFVLRCVKGY